MMVVVVVQEWRTIAQSWKPDSVAPSSMRIRVDKRIEAAHVLRAPEPAYPHVARMAGVQGLVRLAAIVAENGYIQSLSVISGHPLLVRAAIIAVARWQFEPTVLNGQPLQVETEIDVNFALER